MKKFCPYKKCLFCQEKSGCSECEIFLKRAALIMPVVFSATPISADDHPAIGEIVSKRTENSKTFYTGSGRFVIESSIGAIHYKDNYSDDKEQWYL